MMDHGGVDNGTTVVQNEVMDHGGSSRKEMKGQWDQLKIRLPASLKTWLTRRAAANFRSINAETVFLIESARQKEDASTAATVEASSTTK